MIHQQIRQEAVYFETKTGLQPNAIFLGYQEYDALKAWALAAAGFVFSDDTENARPEFNGWRIFEVKAQTHLSVGITKL